MPTSSDLILDPALRTRVEAFLTHETALLDAREYAQWIDLFTPDGIYWVPSNRDDSDPHRDVSLIYDDVRRLRERLVRAGSGMFWAQDPPTRTTRLTGNLALRAHDVGLEATVRLVLVTLRRGATEILSGRCRYVLATEADTWRIQRKEVFLIHNDVPQINLTFLP